jgi:hypothetical protein
MYIKKEEQGFFYLKMRSLKLLALVLLNFVSAKPIGVSKRSYLPQETNMCDEIDIYEPTVNQNYLSDEIHQAGPDDEDDYDDRSDGYSTGTGTNSDYEDDGYRTGTNSDRDYDDDDNDYSTGSHPEADDDY